MQDSIVAIACVSSSQARIMDNCIFGSRSFCQNLLTYDCSMYPDEDYTILEQQIFSALHCSHEDLLTLCSRKRTRGADDLSQNNILENRDSFHPMNSTSSYDHIIEGHYKPIEIASPCSRIVLPDYQRNSTTCKFRSDHDSEPPNSIISDSFDVESTSEVPTDYSVTDIDSNMVACIKCFFNGTENSFAASGMTSEKIVEESDW